jgi:hypothetical protein
MKIPSAGHVVFSIGQLIMLSLCADWSVAEPALLPAGMSVPLVLQHHVSSSYTPVGAPVYFRVARDVTIDGQTLIARGALAKGNMAHTTEPGMVGKSGSMNLQLDSVPAVDGTIVRIDADLDMQGRSRGAATVGWTIFWGLPGMITRGVSPYLEKGAELVATVTSDATIDPANAIVPANTNESGLRAVITKHVWEDKHANSVKVLDIERKTRLKTIAFTVVLPDADADDGPTMSNLQLLEVDDVPVPEETDALAISHGAAIFDGWSIARYCVDGTNALRFGGVDSNGQQFHASYQLPFKIKKKKRKDKN